VALKVAATYRFYRMESENARGDDGLSFGSQARAWSRLGGVPPGSRPVSHPTTDARHHLPEEASVGGDKELLGGTESREGDGRIGQPGQRQRGVVNAGLWRG
jgi:hypothetical protein